MSYRIAKLYEGCREDRSPFRHHALKNGPVSGSRCGDLHLDTGPAFGSRSGSGSFQ